MTATLRAGWMELLAAALAHDIGNLAHSLSSAQSLARAGAADDLEAGEWATYVERDVDRLRKLGVRLRALAVAGEIHSTARLDDACAQAVAEADPGGRQVRRAASPAADARVRGTTAVLRAAIVSLLEHAMAASPTGAPIELTVRDAPGGAFVVEIAAPAATASDVFARDRLDALLDTGLRDRRGDFSLVLAGAIVDALDGAVHVASDSKRGLVFDVQFVAGPA